MVPVMRKMLWSSIETNGTIKSYMSSLSRDDKFTLQHIFTLMLVNTFQGVMNSSTLNPLIRLKSECNKYVTSGALNVMINEVPYYKSSRLPRKKTNLSSYS